MINSIFLDSKKKFKDSVILKLMTNKQYHTIGDYTIVLSDIILLY
jgi:hypothetical protein